MRYKKQRVSKSILAFVMALMLVLSPIGGIRWTPERAYAAEVTFTIYISDASNIVVKKNGEPLTEYKLDDSETNNTPITIEYDAPISKSYEGATSSGITDARLRHWIYSTTDTVLVSDTSLTLTSSPVPEYSISGTHIASVVSSVPAYKKDNMTFYAPISTENYTLTITPESDYVLTEVSGVSVDELPTAAGEPYVLTITPSTTETITAKAELALAVPTDAVLNGGGSEDKNKWYTITTTSAYTKVKFADNVFPDSLASAYDEDGYELQYAIEDGSTTTVSNSAAWTNMPASLELLVNVFGINANETGSKNIFFRYSNGTRHSAESDPVTIQIDNKNPAFDDSYTVTGAGEKTVGSDTQYWGKDSVTLSVPVTDEESGVADVEYGFVSTDSATPGSLSTATYNDGKASLSYAISDKNSYLYVKATDQVGNTNAKYYSLDSIFFDKTPPSAMAEGTEIKYYSVYSAADSSSNEEITDLTNFDQWLEQGVYVVATPEDAAGVAANESPTGSGIKEVVLSDTSGSTQIMTPDGEGNYVCRLSDGSHDITVTAYDYADNSVSATGFKTIMIDETGITDAQVVLQPDRSAYKNAFDVKAIAASLSGIKEVTYVYLENGIEIAGSKQIYTGTDIDAGSRPTYQMTAQTPENLLDQKRDLTVSVTFKDNCNREKTVESNRFSYNTKGSEITFENTNGTWQKNDITVPIRIKDIAGIDEVTFMVNDSPVDAERTSYTSTTGEYVLTLSENSLSTGTKVSVSVKNQADATTLSEFLYRLDKTAPVVTLSGVTNGNQYSSDQTLTIKLDENIWNEMTVTAVASRTMGEDTQNIDLGTITAQSSSTSIEKVFTEEGIYHIQITAKDAAGNSDQKSVQFLIDKTAPIVSFQNRNGNWTNQNVTVPIRVTEGLSGIQNVVVTENGTVVTPTVVNDSASEKNYVITLTNDSPASGTRVAVTATNEAGVTVTSEYTYRLDKTAPSLVLSGVTNGNVYNLNQTVSVRAEDNNWADMQPVTITATRLLDGVTTDQDLGSFSLNTRSTVNTRSFSEDGVYLVTATAVDAAGNQTIQTIGFTLDKTAPVLSITGAPDGAYSGNPVTLNFQAIESFYETDNVTITVERQYEGSAYGSRVNFVNSGKNSNVSNTFATDGDYTVIMTATDGAGNVATEQTIHFTVDVTAPVVSIMGTKDYLVTKDQVSVEFSVTESYFETNQVRITGNRRGADGTVENLNIEGWTNTAKVSTLSKAFTEDGYYTLTITSTDRAGNSRQETIHFTIDTQPPVIADLSRYNGKYLKGFVLEETLEDMISELTSPTVRMTLNGSAYDGSEITEDGKYTLIIEVTDEVGLAATRTIEFIIDNTPPKVIFAGAKDGEWYTEPIRLNITLENENDTIDGITINGEQQDMQGKTFYEYSFNSFDDYEVVVYTSDAAGNTNSQTISFTYAEHAKTSYLWIFITASVLACGLIGGLVIAGVKKKKN